jgi:hypothetical protein
VTRFIPGLGLAATTPDNMPGTFTAPVPPPPPPRVAAPTLPDTLTAVQRAEATHQHAAREFENWRRLLPASDPPIRGREFVNTDAARRRWWG